MRTSDDVSLSSSSAAEASFDRRPSLTDLIEVRAPYCALQHVSAESDGGISAVVSPEQQVDLEFGEIAAAEAGRHMAILGSIASALHQKDPARRCYYLAERAVLSSPDDLPAADGGGGSMRLRARCTQTATRSADAECEIRSAAGRPLFGLRVSYKLVPDRLFERLFAAHRVDMRRAPARSVHPLSEAAVLRLRRSPYRTRLPLAIQELDAQQVRGEIASVSAEACAGHFPLYPAVPVAVLMEAFSNAGGALLRHRLGDPSIRYRVRSADIVASRLVFAGQSITIRGDLLELVSDRGAKMQMRASLANGEEVSRATFVMDGVPNDGRTRP